jgi:hypothetical protein
MDFRRSSERSRIEKDYYSKLSFFMERVKIGSSHIDDVGYDKEKKILEIGFWNGWIYRYYDVPLQTYLNFFRSMSKGIFFHKYIRKKYRYKKIRTVPGGNRTPSVGLRVGQQIEPKAWYKPEKGGVVRGIQNKPK